MSEISDKAEFWLDELAQSADDIVRCPVDGSYQFTAHYTWYGIKLACWMGPHYIGIRQNDIEVISNAHNV